MKSKPLPCCFWGNLWLLGGILFYYVVIPFNQPEEKAGLWDMPENIIRP